MAGPRTRFYRDGTHGKIAGVCAGLSDHFGTDVTLVRVGVLATALITGWGILVYFVLVWMTPVRMGEVPEGDVTEQRFWREVRKNPRRSARSVRARFREIDRRLADVEAHLTSPDKRLAREIDGLR